LEIGCETPFKGLLIRVAMAVKLAFPAIMDYLSRAIHGA
jgi:hypothetical protein